MRKHDELDFNAPHKEEWRFFACKKCSFIKKYFMIEKPDNWDDENYWKYTRWCPVCRKITRFNEFM